MTLAAPGPAIPIVAERSRGADDSHDPEVANAIVNRGGTGMIKAIARAP
jgi:hypothetical protein